MTKVKRSRKDATRNRLSILNAAERVFALKGLDASVEDIAAAAGLGVASIYRAFGSKAGLIQELFTDVVDRSVVLIDECAKLSTAWDALCETVRRLSRMQIEERGAYQALFDPSESATQLLRERIQPRLTAIIDKARAEGSVRSDFAATDIAVLVHAASATAALMGPRGTQIASRHVELLLKGIAASPDPAVVPPPLADDDFSLWLGAAFPR